MKVLPFGLAALMIPSVALAKGPNPRRVARAHGFRIVGEARKFDVLVRGATRRPDGEE
jgi:hypothetical protein